MSILKCNLINFSFISITYLVVQFSDNLSQSVTDYSQSVIVAYAEQ
jgi:hypothetical protein